MAASAQYGDITPVLLSGLTDGVPLLITVTNAGASQLVHTAVSGSVDLDQVTLMANNDHTSDVDVVVLVGGVTEPDNVVCLYTVKAKTGPQILMDHYGLRNAKTVKVYASVGSKITVFGPPVSRTNLS